MSLHQESTKLKINKSQWRRSRWVVIVIVIVIVILIAIVIVIVIVIVVSLLKGNDCKL